MNDTLINGLKRLSKQLQEKKDPDNIVVMEALCEIEDLQAKFDEISSKYVQLIKECRELSQTLIDSGNERLISPDWKDTMWQVGYITGVQDSVNLVNERRFE